MIEFSPFIRGKFVLKKVSVWLCFSRQTKVEFAEGGPRSAGGMSTTTRNKGLVPQCGIVKGLFNPLPASRMSYGVLGKVHICRITPCLNSDFSCILMYCMEKIVEMSVSGRPNLTLEIGVPKKKLQQQCKVFGSERVNCQLFQRCGQKGMKAQEVGGR